MNDRVKIPDAETRARSVAKMRELVKRMDANILQLDELITRLEADIRNSPLTAYRLGKAKRAILRSRCCRTAPDQELS